MSTHRHYTASALVFGTDDRVLIIEHVKSGLWLPPGGHIEPGETPAEAAVREVREETGVEARIVTGPVFEHPAVTGHAPPLMIIEATAADPVNGPHQHIDFLYACRAAGGDGLQPAAGEVTGARWAALADLDNLAVPAELPELVMHALAWVRTSGRDVPAQRDPAGGLLVAMATSNPAKAATAREHLAPYGITVEHVPLQMEEIQADSVGEVALHKARQAHAALGGPVITEDSGFCIEELDGFPGPLAKPVTSMLGLAVIIRLADITTTRAAHFESAVAYIDSAGARTFTSTGPAGTVAHRGMVAAVGHLDSSRRGPAGIGVRGPRVQRLPRCLAGQVGVHPARRVAPGPAGGEPVTVFTWHEAPVPDGLAVRQVHGWLADTTGRVLIQDRRHEGKYLLPGGGCDRGDQSWAATLIRECAEESQITLVPATIIYLGHQVVTGDPGVPGAYAQVRLFAVIGAFEPVTPDPDSGHEYRRLMTSIPAASRLLNWGLPGELQAQAAARTGRQLGLPVDQPVPDSYA